MADFHKAFEAIDEDGSGEITVDELQHYMIKNNYKASFVSKWLTLFDGDKSGKITYEHYCETLGLVPKEREPLEGRKDAGREETIRESRTAGEAGQPPKRKEEAIKTTGEATQPSKTAVETVRPAKTTDARTKLTADSADATKSAPVNPQPDPQSRTVPSKAAPSNKKAATAPPTTTTTKEKMATVDSSTNDGVVPMDTQEDGRATKSTRGSKRHTDRRRKSFRDHKKTLRPSIAPGVILILLTGIHRGKRVVFLKQLASGLLLVTGPFRINGCPLRRVHQRFVIATGTRLDISSVPPVPDHITDEYFSRRYQSQSRSSRRNTDRQKVHSDVTNIFAKSKKQYELKDERKADQKSVDAHIITAIRNREDKSIFARYLRSLFTLSSHDLPHKMQF